VGAVEVLEPDAEVVYDVSQLDEPVLVVIRNLRIVVEM
jgi:hypothetical protein